MRRIIDVVEVEAFGLEPEGGIPVFRVRGYAQFGELWVARVDDGVWIPLWPVRGLPPRLPVRDPEGAGWPTLVRILNAFEIGLPPQAQQLVAVAHD